MTITATITALPKRIGRPIVSVEQMSLSKPSMRSGVSGVGTDFDGVLAIRPTTTR